MNKYIIITVLALITAIHSHCQNSIKVFNPIETNIFKEHTNDPYNVPTPNQSSLGSYGIIPVSPYTGKADISVPLYETTQRGVTLNVFLSYDTSGLLINQLPSWTGHNWNLIAGGAITRKINGRPDELSFHNTGAGRDVFVIQNQDFPYIMSNGQYYDYLNIPESDYNYYEIMRSNILGNARRNVQVLDGFTNYFSYSNRNDTLTCYGDISQCDTSADIFHFTFMGISGSFFYGNDGKWKVACDKNIAVIFDVNDSTNYISPLEETYWFNENNCNSATKELIVKQPKTIKGFTLIDDNGNKYIFGGDKNTIEYSMSFTGKAWVNTTEPWNAVSWMLKEVQDRFGNTLYSFRYSKGKHIVQLHNAYNYVTYTSKVPSTNPVQQSYKYYSGTLNSPVYLDEINVIDGTKLHFLHSNIFNDNASSILYPNGVNIESMLQGTYKRLLYQDDLSSRSDYDPVHYYYVCSFMDSCSHYLNTMNLEQLKAIHIGRTDTSIQDISDKTYTLLYDFNNRMHLTSIVMGKENNIFSYNFEYEGFDSIPSDYLTKKFDHWGYYNGINYDAVASESIALSQNETQSAEKYKTRSISDSKMGRVADYNYSVLGMLRKITYPTGGYSTIDYEQNSCSRYLSDNKQNVFNFNSNVLVGGLRIKSIKNFDNDLLIGEKSYSYCYPGTNISSGELYSIPNTSYDFEDATASYKMDVACSIGLSSNSFVPNVGYSFVRETDLSGNSIDYTFSNFSTEKDEECQHIRFDNMTPFDETSSRLYMCGKLLTETQNDSIGEPIKQTRYTYYSDNDYNRTNYVTTTSFCKHEKVGNVGSVHKLYYFKTGINNIVTKNKYGNHWVTDSLVFDRRYKTLCLTNTNGYTYNSDVFKNCSETIIRGDHQLKTEYTYPFSDVGINSILTSQFYLPVTGIKKYTNGTLFVGEKTIYCNMGSIVPKYNISFNSDSTICDTTETYVTYSPTYRVTKLIDKNNVLYSLFWNDNDQLIATIVNNNDQVQVGSDIASTIALNSNTLFTTKPIDTKLYEYDSMGRLSKEVSSNNLMSSYEYDSFDRLTDTYNTNGEKTHHYSYNYRNIDNLYSLYHGSINYAGVIEEVLRVEYHLPYIFDSAEIRVVHLYSGNIINSHSIKNTETDGVYLMPFPNPKHSSPYNISLYIDGHPVQTNVIYH